MAEELTELPDFTHTQTVWFKGKDGTVKELSVKMPMPPDQIRMTVDDNRLLAKEISKQLRMEGY